MIKFDKVVKELAGKEVLNELTFEVQRGEIFVIVGASGTGKSVTLKHMVRLMTADSGDIFVEEDNISVAEGSDLERIRQKFGYLFQGGALLAWMSLTDNVALPLQEKRPELSPEEICKKAYDTLALVGLEDDGEKFPSEISGGMRKRAGLARAIITEPEIILYDEPTSGLDPVSSRTIDSLIQSMQRELGITSVVVTHDLHSALSIGTRIAMLHGGKVIELGTPDEFLHSPQSEVQDFLASQFITKKGSWEGGRT